MFIIITVIFTHLQYKFALSALLKNTQVNKIVYVSDNFEISLYPLRLHNWGGNFEFSTQNIQYLRTTEEVQQIVSCARKLRVVASRHSFSTIADSNDTLISTLRLRNIIGLNMSIPSVIVQADITYTDLAPFLCNCLILPGFTFVL